MFLLAKVLSYTILGFLLGALGSFLTLSLRLQGTLQIFIGLFMLGTAARLLNLHPIFRFLVIQPPKSVYRLLKNRSKNSSLFAPAILGFLTVLMPCGVTQAMMVLAMGTGSPWLGAAIMLSFTIGTSPVFFALGVTTLGLLKHRKFESLAAVLVAAFAFLSINGGLNMVGSIYTFQNFKRAAGLSFSGNALAASGKVAGVSKEGRQEVTIHIRSNGYSSSITTLKSGVPVDLTLVSQNAGGCARAFTIPSLNISKIVPVSGNSTIAFTPNRPGKLLYSCSMGMYTGEFDVI